MRARLDTHTLLWWLSDDPGLTARARKFIAETDNSCVVSAASAWEIATKFHIGNLPSASHLVTDFMTHLEQERFELLSISLDHAMRAGLLPARRGTPLIVC